MPHPDAARLRDVLDMMNAGNPDDPKDPHFTALMEELFDEDTAIAMARERVATTWRFLPEAVKSKNSMIAFMMAIWMEGFTAGIMFQRSGGHHAQGSE